MWFLSFCFLCAVVCFCIGFFIENGLNDNMANMMKKNIKPCAIALVVFSMLGCVTPSKETCEEMMIASVVTHENVDQAKDDVKSIIDYVFDKIENNDSESE